MGIILTFTTTFFIFSGIATSATNQNNPLFDSVYNINTYNNPNAISGSNNIVNIGNGNNNNTNTNTNTRGTGDRLEDYNITDNQLDEFLNNVDENGNLKGSANYNPLPVNNNSNVNNSNSNYNTNINYNNSSNNTNSTRNTVANNNKDIQLGYSVDGFPCTVLRSFMKYGHNNQEVRALQIFLFTTGYMTVFPNGNFGPATRAAVLAFQGENNIDTKGYVGPNTRAKIAEYTCGQDEKSIATAYKGIVYKPIIRKTQVVKRVINTPSPTIDTSDENIQDISEPQIDNNTNDLSAIFDKNSQPTNTNNNSNPNTKSFSGNKPTDYVLFEHNINKGDIVKACIEYGNDNICNNISNFALVTSLSTKSNLNAVFDVNTSKWLIFIYYTENWSEGGKVILRTTSAKTKATIKRELTIRN